MVVFFKGLELCNFKSFKGKVTIDSFKDFVAIVGPNGCGKSNVIDAVCFVMGEVAKNLRVKRISELIYGASVGTVSSRASVTAFFELQDGTAITFTRSIRNNASEFKINNEVVTVHTYTRKLAELGIKMRAQNFVIYQGMVDRLALQNTKERTQQFEEISNSAELENEYNRLKNDEYQAKLEVCEAKRAKEDLIMEKKSLLLQINEANSYKKLQKNYMKKQTQLQLFKLYHIQKDVENFLNLKEELELKISKIQQEKGVVQEVLTQMKKENYELIHQLSDKEKYLYEMEAKLAEEKLNYALTGENLEQLQSKITSSKSCAARAKLAMEARSKNIRDLEDALQTIKEQKALYESNISSQSTSQTDSIDMTESQLSQYHELKNEAMKHVGQHMLVLDSINNDQNMDNDFLENKKRQRMELESELKRKKDKRASIINRINKLEEFITSTEMELNKQINIKNELQTEISTSKTKMQHLQEDLDKVVEQRQNAKIDNHLITNMKDKAETVRILKERYSGVYGRLFELCKPIRSTFNVAVAKVFGRNMDAIITATEKDAMECIRYLKEQKISRETFLPLDSLKVTPVKAKLRNIKERNVKLLYDVIKFSPNEINSAILFATDNALVCETAEDANYVAYEMNPTEKYNCVSLDGTYYKKSGIISGGEVDLQRNARKWEDNLLMELKSKEENLRKQIRACLESTRKDYELNILNLQVMGLQTRLRFSQGDLEQAKKDIHAVEKELKDIEQKIEVVNDLIEEIEFNINNRSVKAERVKNKISNIEDQIFHEFCNDIGVKNIREFERRDLLAHQEREKKRLELEECYNRIFYQIEFEKDPEVIRKINENIERWERTVHEAERNFEITKEEESRRKINLALHENEIQKLSEECNKMSNNVDNTRKKIANSRNKMAQISKEFMALERDMVSVITKIKKTKADWDFIFQNAKTEDIHIPTNAQNSNDFSETFSSSGMNTGELSEHFLEIDFSDLSDNYKSRSPEHIEGNTGRLTDEVNEISRKLNSIINPNFKASERMDILNEKIDEIEMDLREKRKVANEIANAFKKVKQERLDRFTECFQAVAIHIDSIYKSLVGSDSAQAILVPENPEEPYLGGIRFDCVAPGKRLQSMSEHSGGEKTLAVLALLFAQCSYMQPPFLLLDEIDAALDNYNIRRVTKYICSKKSAMQIIAVSLKSKFSSCADYIVGITAEPGDIIESKIYGCPKGFESKNKGNKIPI